MKKDNEIENVKKKSNNNIVFIFSILMVVVYCGMGYLIIFSPLFNQDFSFPVRIIVGILLLIYGLFRAYRLIKEKNEENEK